MSPLENPFAPGAGVRPPELAGRDELLDTIHVAAERTRRKLAARSVLLLGLRGVGKTVVLDRAQERAAVAGLTTVMVEASDRSPLPAVLAAELHGALLRLSRQRRVRALATRALGVLAGFAAALKVKYGDVELGIGAPVEARGGRQRRSGAGSGGSVRDPRRGSVRVGHGAVRDRRRDCSMSRRRSWPRCAPRCTAPRNDGCRCSWPGPGCRSYGRR